MKALLAPSSLFQQNGDDFCLVLFQAFGGIALQTETLYPPCLSKLNCEFVSLTLCSIAILKLPSPETSYFFFLIYFTSRPFDLLQSQATENTFLQYYYILFFLQPSMSSGFPTSLFSFTFQFNSIHSFLFPSSYDQLLVDSQWLPSPIPCPSGTPSHFPLTLLPHSSPETYLDATPLSLMKTASIFLSLLACFSSVFGIFVFDQLSIISGM